VTLSYAASGGPGGQNVNKVASKAVLRWSAVRSPSLREDERALLSSRLASRLTREGELVLSSERHRDQPRNVADVLERFASILRAALRPPVARRRTRPTRASKERRLSGKRRASERKRLRRGPPSGD
jgi:ribosome-associated protein